MNLPSKEITCREFIQFLIEYLSGELPAERKDCFDAHLAECPSCVAFMKSYSRTTRIARDAYSHPDQPVPDDVPEDLVRAILACRDLHKR